MGNTENTVVVGYDQSPAGERALRFAALDAESRGAELVVVHARRFTPTPAPALFPTAGPHRRHTAVDVAETGAEHVRARFPGVKVVHRCGTGSAPRVLTDAARGADLLVVGNRGLGGFSGLLLGSVSARVLGGARGPVAVVHERGHARRGLVVAAVDVDSPCGAVLGFAADAASAHRADLAVVHAWERPWLPDDVWFMAEVDLVLARALADREDRLAALARTAATGHPGLPVAHRIVTGTAGYVLVRESRGADLVVAGARRHGGHGGARPGLRIGPVTAELVRHAECPVAVVPHD